MNSILLASTPCSGAKASAHWIVSWPCPTVATHSVPLESATLNDSSRGHVEGMAAIADQVKSRGATRESERSMDQSTAGCLRSTRDTLLNRRKVKFRRPRQLATMLTIDSLLSVHPTAIAPLPLPLSPPSPSPSPVSSGSSTARFEPRSNRAVLRRCLCHPIEDEAEGGDEANPRALATAAGRMEQPYTSRVSKKGRGSGRDIAPPLPPLPPLSMLISVTAASPFSSPPQAPAAPPPPSPSPIAAASASTPPDTDAPDEAATTSQTNSRSAVQWSRRSVFRFCDPPMCREESSPRPSRVRCRSEGSTSIATSSTPDALAPPAP